MSNEVIFNMNVFYEMLEINHGFKTCTILNDNAVSRIITEFAVFHVKLCTIAIILCTNRDFSI